jgi:hypothetical protein
MKFKWKVQIARMWGLVLGVGRLSALAGLALTFSAAAQTIQWPVTPNQLEYSNFVFSVTTLLTNGGTAFHVTITTKTGAIQPDSIASLAMVTGKAALPAIAGVKPAVPVTIQRTDRMVSADFTAPAELLDNPAAYFIFVVTDYQTNQDGTRTYLPTDRMYEIRLRDFLPQ